MKMKKRFLGILLSLVMVLGLMLVMSLTALAGTDTYTIKVQKSSTQKTQNSNATLPYNLSAGAILSLFSENGSASGIELKNGNNISVSGTDITVNSAGESSISIQRGIYMPIDYTIIVTKNKSSNPLTYVSQQTVTKTISTASQTAALASATDGQGTVSYAINSQKNSLNADVTYFSLDGTTLTIAANTPVGTYTVVVRATAAGNEDYNSGTKDSTVTVTVNMPDPTAPTGLTATYGQTLADVTLPEGWAWADSTQSVGNVVSPSATFKANFAGNNSYNAASNVDVTVTVGKAENPATVAETAQVLSGYEKIDLADYVTLNGTTGTVSYETNDEENVYELEGSILTSGEPKENVTVDVKVKIAEDANYKALEKTIKVTIISIPVTGITVEPAKDTMLIGDDLVLRVNYTPGNATDKYYETGGYDESIVDVDGAGIVYAKAAGTTTITVTATNGTDDKSDDCTATCEITVNKLDSKVTKAPEAKGLTYSGQAQELVTAGTAKGGTVQYALGTDDKTAPTSGYTTSIPTGTNAGTYYVWFKVVGDKKYNDIASQPISVTIAQKETETEKQTESEKQTEKQTESQTEKPDTTPSGGGGGALPQTTDPASTPNTSSETAQQPTTTGDPTITQDAFTGVSETIETSADGTASVTSISGTAGNTLRITGTVNQGGTNYPVSGFATNAFSNVDVKNIFIDLKASGNNTQTVTFQPRTFKGSEAKKLTLRLSSSGQVKFSSGALSGSKIKKVVVSGLKKKEFKKVEKKLRKSGYKGKIVKK